mmetsp:Transcript_7978/g.11887  ORF Transcript_7978/g.11887 Transcript_7978/m.11887 type:complete len:80 (+) Transcript_7978:247-486(+)
MSIIPPPTGLLIRGDVSTSTLRSSVPPACIDASKLAIPPSRPILRRRCVREDTEGGSWFIFRGGGAGGRPGGGGGIATG